MKSLCLQVHREFQQPEMYSKVFRDIGLLPANECKTMQSRRSKMGTNVDPVKTNASQRIHRWQMPWYLAEKLDLDTPALLQALGKGAACLYQVKGERPCFMTTAWTGICRRQLYVQRSTLGKLKEGAVNLLSTTTLMPEC